VRSGAILSQYTKIPIPVIATMTRARYGEALTAALMQPVIDVAATTCISRRSRRRS